jgi:hypothetical protein
MTFKLKGKFSMWTHFGLLNVWKQSSNRTFLCVLLKTRNPNGKGSDLTAVELCRFSETKYKHLFEAGKWKLSSVVSTNDSVNKEVAKFVALVSTVKELAKDASKPLAHAEKVEI